MLEHTIFMLKNFYVTDIFMVGSFVCFLIATVAGMIVMGVEYKGIQRENEKLIKRCEFWVIISLIGHCILAILNFTFLPYSVGGLSQNRIIVWFDLVLILLYFVYIRDAIKKLAMIIGENKKL